MNILNPFSMTVDKAGQASGTHYLHYRAQAENQFYIGKHDTKPRFEERSTFVAIYSYQGPNFVSLQLKSENPDIIVYGEEASSKALGVRKIAFDSGFAKDASFQVVTPRNGEVGYISLRRPADWNVGGKDLYIAYNPDDAVFLAENPEPIRSSFKVVEALSL